MLINNELLIWWCHYIISQTWLLLVVSSRLVEPAAVGKGNSVQSTVKIKSVPGTTLSNLLPTALIGSTGRSVFTFWIRLCTCLHECFSSTTFLEKGKIYKLISPMTCFACFIVEKDDLHSLHGAEDEPTPPVSTVFWRSPSHLYTSPANKQS